MSIAGSAQPVGRKVVSYVLGGGGSPRSSVIGARERTSKPMAALANGVLAHAMDFDSAGGFGHPAAVIFPALLAVAERQRASGDQLLVAFVVGCQVGLALFYNGGSAATAFQQMKRGIHATAVFGRIGAAAECANLCRLSTEQTVRVRDRCIIRVGLGSQFRHRHQAPARGRRRP